MNSVNEVQESIKIALDAADAATDVTSEYNKIKNENKKLEASVKQVHKYTTIIFGISILAALIGLSLTALIYSRTMNELSAMTSTSREALVVFAENVDGVKTALEQLQEGIQEQGKILETNNALIESINSLDDNLNNTNKMLVSEISNLANNVTKNMNASSKKSMQELNKLVKTLKDTQVKTTNKLINLSKQATNKGLLTKISSNQNKMNKNFNDLAKAVNNLANQSGELAKKVTNSSVIKYP